METAIKTRNPATSWKLVVLETQEIAVFEAGHKWKDALKSYVLTMGQWTS